MLGQLHFIGPASSYTHTLPMHCCIDGLSWLVCFSGAGFADHVKSQLTQWGPWRALDRRCGSDIHHCVSEASLKALQACLGLWLTGLIATPNSPIGSIKSFQHKLVVLKSSAIYCVPGFLNSNIGNYSIAINTYLTKTVAYILAFIQVNTVSLKTEYINLLCTTSGYTC